jgi:alpha-mannosidase
MSRPFTIYVIQSAHTDIGYTHPQEQIALMYLDHYDRVLELCGQTANAPESQRFKWVCETAWQVRHYLNHPPHQTSP